VLPTVPDQISIGYPDELRQGVVGPHDVLQGVVGAVLELRQRDQAVFHVKLDHQNGGGDLERDGTTTKPLKTPHLDASHSLGFGSQLPRLVRQVGVPVSRQRENPTLAGPEAQLALLLVVLQVVHFALAPNAPLIVPVAHHGQLEEDHVLGPPANTSTTTPARQTTKRLRQSDQNQLLQLLLVLLHLFLDLFGEASHSRGRRSGGRVLQVQVDEFELFGEVHFEESKSVDATKNTYFTYGESASSPG
jgi:hypothetical protein